MSFSIYPGIQGPDHPNPGKPYHLNGFPRTCYIPNSEEGQHVLGLLKKAFDRRLIFTVGTSHTTHTPDCVVWAGIHHKTEIQNHRGHGYPAPDYLKNVQEELKEFGVE